MIAKKILNDCLVYQEKTAIIAGGRSYTYGDLKAETEKLIQMVKKLKLEEREPVAIIMPNCFEFPAMLFAAELTGHCAVLLNDKLRQEEIRYHADHAKVRYFVTLKKDYGLYKACGFCIKQELENVVIWERISEAAWQNEVHYQADDYICQVTSGTNGMAKGVVRTVSAVTLEIEETVQCTNMQGYDVFLTIPPLCHSFGLVAGALTPLCMGATLILPETFMAADIVNSIFTYHVTILFAVPFMYQMLCEVKEAKNKLSSLKLCFSAGAPMQQDVSEKFYEISRVPIIQDYGSTETGVMCMNMNAGSGNGSVGIPVGSRHFKVIDENGNECKACEEGYFITKSACDARAYLYPAKLNANYLNGWLRLGDYGHIDHAGAVYVKGRMSDFINVAGMKVDPAEVENIIMRLQGVEEVAVIGINSKQYGEVVKACVVAAEHVGKRDIIECCRSKIAHYKVPKIIEFRESLPKSGKGTIIKKYLR
ncbi:MAG: AMP-binding protein [Clostridium sp.]|nr:AMP-binding protein [Clostridium sp.]MCM1398263.1 AMP-binding protein [Clostridium sp.]MCM1459073.1 AMP-binding protein [Bacteroides sp.]